jgi:uncharacterized phage protein gp47/JayE
MTIVYPENKQEVADRILTDIQNELPELNPFLKASAIRAIAIAIAGRLFDVYKQQEQSQDELFPDTATVLDFIRRFGLFKGRDVDAATAAVGFITATGVIGSTIPIATIFQTSTGVQYSVINQAVTIQTVLYNVASLSRSGSTATAVFSTNHNLATGVSMTVAGAIETDYNGTFVITATGEDELTYELTGTPTTPATGSITATSTIGNTEVRSVEAGGDKNLISGAILSLNIPIAGVDNDAAVQFTGLVGGTDTETTAAYQTAVINLYAHPISNFNNADVERAAKRVANITRVWTFDATPIAGESETYVVQDGEASVIPPAHIIDEVKTEILKIKCVPMRDVDVHVFAPTPVSVDFVFTGLVPDTQAMRDAIKGNLEEFFRDVPNVSESVLEDSYRAIIIQTINPESSEFVKTFTLTSPIGDISVLDGELAIFGSVNWNIT